MRVTKEVRNDIVVSALAFKFRDRKAALEKARERLGDEVYHYAVGSVEATARLLPDGWVAYNTSVKIKCEGFGDRYQWFGCGSERKRVQMQADRHLPMSQTRPTPGNGVDLNIEKGHTLYKSAQTIAKEFVAIYDSEKELEQKLRVLLASCNTVKQLLAAWPEGAPFFPQEVRHNTALIPITLTNEINKSLGLESKQPVRKALSKAARKEIS